MRLIDGDPLLAKMKRRREYVGRPSDPVCLVEDAPTVDAVPVVRCKDCAYSYFADNRVPAEQSLVCERTGCDVTPDWFCAGGRRR